MSSNGSSTNSPPSTGGEAPTTWDNYPSPSATEPTPPPAAAIGLEISPSSDEAPVPPAQIGADRDGVDAAINGSMQLIENEEEAPVPPAQTAAEHEEMESTIKKSALQTQSEDVPMTPSQVAAGFEDMDQATKEKTRDANSSGSGMGPPLSLFQMAELAEKTGEDDEENGLLVVPPTAEEEETLQRAQDPPTPAVTLAPSPPPADQGRSPSNPRVQQQLPIRPPPQSMMPSSDDDTDPRVSALLRDRSIPRLRATLVEDQVVEATLIEDRSEAIAIPDLQVYNAGQLAEQTRFEKNKKLIIGVGMGLLTGAAVATGVSVSAIKSTSDTNTVVPQGVVLSTARPSGSSSPSDVTSQRPTLQPSTALPSESSSPSQYPSVRPTLRPSQSANPSQSPSRSLRPSLIPSTSASPTPFCFGGEINILTDSYPEETSWTLSRIDNVDGVANSKVVLEGSPKKEGYLTSDEACLERGDYEFAIFDHYGDGIDSPGYYSVAFGGVVIAQGGGFESEEKFSFSLPLPSPLPSESSSPSELPSASFHPSESIIPSQSLSPSFWPSVSLSPSEIPSSSLQPSTLPSSPPSTYWSTLSWNRQGLGFNGDVSDDFFGSAVAFSADALTMAVGAPGRFGDNDRAGYVVVYRREGEDSSWEQRGDTIHGEANGDNFGSSLSLSEDGTALSIGAPRHDSVGPDSGQVKVYKWEETALKYMQSGDTLYGSASGDRFGYSLDISNGKVLAVGADESDANGINSGQVTVYAWDDASSNYRQRGEVINGGAAEDYFGYSVSLAENGQKLAVGATGNNSNGSLSGQVRVFEWKEVTSNYEQLGESLLGDAAGDNFGRSVSISRNGLTLAIGAPYNGENGPNAGQVKVFAWDEATSNFLQNGQSIYGKAPDDQFGKSVALAAGKTLAVGAVQYNAGKPGYVEVYAWDEAALEYRQLGRSLGGKASGDNFGYALALADNGRDLAVTAPLSDQNGNLSGRVEVFDIEL